jgi:hypothetical protein
MGNRRGNYGVHEMSNQTLADLKNFAPAFPNVFGIAGQEQVFPGLSFRDYFAAQSISGRVSYQEDDFDRIAKNAYAMADAMIRARQS